LEGSFNNSLREEVTPLPRTISLDPAHIREANVDLVTRYSII